jgi:hypothetical protein
MSPSSVAASPKLHDGLLELDGTSDGLSVRWAIGDDVGSNDVVGWLEDKGVGTADLVGTRVAVGSEDGVAERVVDGEGEDGELGCNVVVGDAVGLADEVGESDTPIHVSNAPAHQNVPLQQSSRVG